MNYARPVLIRAKNHWLTLALAAMYIVCAVIIETFKRDHFMVPIYLGFAALVIISWATSFTTLKNGVLEQRLFLFPFRALPVNEIESVRANKVNGKWAYGMVIDIYSRAGKKLSVRPNNPRPFLTLLRKQAPQASFQV